MKKSCIILKIIEGGIVNLCYINSSSDDNFV